MSYFGLGPRCLADGIVQQTADENAGVEPLRAGRNGQNGKAAPTQI